MKKLILFLLIAIFAMSCESSKVRTSSPSAAVINPAQMNKFPWMYHGDEGTQFVSDIWNIRTTIKHKQIVDSLPNFYDGLIDHYTSVFGKLPYPKDRIDVFMFANESQWKLKLQELLGNEANSWYALGRGGLTIDGIGVLYHLDKSTRSRVTFRIAAHEGWHQYAEHAFKSCLPTWLDEGIGTWMEGFRLRRGQLHFTPASNWDRLSAIRKIVTANRLTPLNELINSDPSELLETGRSTLLGYYSQLWAFTSFLMEYENGKFRPVIRDLLLDAVDGTLREPSDGWLFLFTDDKQQLEKEYNDWVVEYVRPGTSWR
ncbi:MAG: hypothetical protein QF718_03820 [Phycisphaerales bacterium]|nr:hypothetical protein [Phycisphaerales bacterium]